MNNSRKTLIKSRLSLAAFLLFVCTAQQYNVPFKHAAAAFTPADLTLFAWWRGDERDADPVGSWTDKSGNGRHATQGTASLKPDIFSGPNSRDCLQTTNDTEDEFLETAAWSAISQPNTIAGVFVFDDSGDSFESLFDGVAGSNRHTLYEASPDFNLYAGSVSSLGAEQTGAHYFIIKFDGASSYARIDGSETAESVGSHTLTGLTILANVAEELPWHGKVCELIIVDGALSTGDRDSLETYFQDYYGL